MHNYLHVIRLSLRYKWSILGAILNAMLIATLWSASISTIHPVIEIIFGGESLSVWVQNQIDSTKLESAKLAGDLARLRQTVENSTSVATSLEQDILAKQARWKAEKAALRRYESIQERCGHWLPTTAFGSLIAVIGSLLLMTLLKGICLILQVVLVGRVANGTVVDLRRKFYRAALDMDQKTFESQGAAQLITLLSHHMGLINQGLSVLYGKAIREPLKMLSCLIAAAFISWKLLVLSLMIAPVGVWIVHHLSQRMRNVAGKEARGMQQVFQTLMETFNGIKTVRAFNRESTERSRFKDDARWLYSIGMRLSFFDALVRPVSELLAIVCIAIAMLVGAHLTLNEQTELFGFSISDRPLAPSHLMLFYALLAGVADPARKMSDMYNTMVRACMASDMLYATFETKPTIGAPANPKRVPLHSESIGFREVNFAYNDDGFALRDLSFEVPFGQTVAFVGENGSGKSTVTSLLARFYDPDTGQVLWDGIDIREFRPKKLRAQIAIVSQSPVLFRGTVWDNIEYGKKDATHDEILAASQIARVDEFINHLPHAYQTEVGDGGQFLSGGQCQRVALARAVLADPRVLILDEATSQLDGHNEGLIHESLRDFLRKRTTILITHRQATLKLADRFVVFRDGRIVADMNRTDPHEESAEFTRIFSQVA